MNKSIVVKARNLMIRQTKKNGAPAWILTEIAISNGQHLAKKYKVDENIVLVSLYLAHTVFSTKIKGRVQQNHESLSADFAKPYLKKWKVSGKDIDKVVNSILCHHGKYEPTSLEAEVMKNAECFKFLTVEGTIVFLHHLGSRGLTLEESVRFAKSKAAQKLGYITLPALKALANKNYKETMVMLDSLSK